MSNLCILGKLDILAFFNISGNTMRPKCFPLVLTLKLWPQIPTFLFYYSDLRWVISVYRGSLTFRLSQHFRKYYEAQKFSFSLDPKALTSNTNPFVLLLWFKMSNLCIWGKLDILAFFNISGNIMRPKSFPLVLTQKLWPQIPTLLFYYSDLRWAISVYGGRLTFRLSSTFQEIFW